ncbi:MAG: IgGFc-binding protein [Deltaproteobacteria bacterium]|nr:IgGFc-binding protein [Deltaproteobacteria bacterium]
MRHGGGLVLGVLMVVWLGCSAGGSGSPTPGPGKGGNGQAGAAGSDPDGSVGGGGTGGDGGAGGAAGDASLGGGGSGGSGGDADVPDQGEDSQDACPPCSADSLNVIDCDGNVIQACAAGEKCAAGVCTEDLCKKAADAKGNYGCEYWTLNLDNILAGACFAAFVTNTSQSPAKITVEYNGAILDIAQFAKIPVGQGSQLQYSNYDGVNGLMPGEVAILFLAVKTPQPAPPLGEPCPSGITPALKIDPAVHGTGRGKAFHITTDTPVVAYQIYPYGGGNAAITSATLLLPVAAWDVNYVAVNGYAKTEVANNWGLPSLDILAAEDGTEVKIKPVAAIEGGTGVPGSPAGQPITYTLDQGQFIQFSQAAELTGSAILSNKPVAVFGGNSCMNIPVGVDACDTAQQQIPPVRAMGNEYAAVRYRGRAGSNESVPWRIVGAVDGTQLSYTPAAPAGAPSTIASGQLVEFQSAEPFVVASQNADHPFYISGHMTGGSQFNGEGDAEFVNVVPTAQYMKSYVFFTDPTYPETNLVVVRKQGQNGFAEVNLDCAGALTGWQPLGPYEYTRIDLVTGKFKSVGGCSNGRHIIGSDAPFGVTVWGWGSNASFPFVSTYVSYAYPAGAGVAKVNSTVVMPD